MQWGDVATWFAVVAATGAASVAFWQLRGQQKVMADQVLIQERQQADQVDVKIRKTSGAQAGVTPEDSTHEVLLVVIANGSKRPIRRVSCVLRMEKELLPLRISPIGYRDLQHDGRAVPASAEEYVYSGFDTLIPLLRAGRSAAFVFNSKGLLVPPLGAWVRFADDAGLEWEVTGDLHLSKLKKTRSYEWREGHPVTERW